MTAGDGAAIERRLAFSYAPARVRPTLEALWAVDAALGAVVAGGGPAAIREIKLVWWRDALAALDDAPPPQQPVLEAAAAIGVPGADLALLEEPWAVLLSEDVLSRTDLADYARRGRILFELSARVLGAVVDETVGGAGEAWALADFARRSRDPEEASAARALAIERRGSAGGWPAALRPLGMLAVAEQVAGAPGSARRVLRMLRHRLTGR